MYKMKERLLRKLQEKHRVANFGLSLSMENCSKPQYDNCCTTQNILKTHNGTSQINQLHDIQILSQ